MAKKAININKRRKVNIYEKYRQILKMPDLTKKELDKMRKNLSFIARTICEHIWGKMFY